MKEKVKVKAKAEVKAKVLQTAFLAFVILMAVSCSTGSCFEETNSYVKASFYLYSGKKMTAPASLTLYGTGSDSVRYDKASQVQPALIPLNPSEDNCSFVIVLNGINDTIYFGYSTFVHLISKECGYTYFHNLDSINTTFHNIDSIHIDLRNITTLDGTNISIFY